MSGAAPTLRPTPRLTVSKGCESHHGHCDLIALGKKVRIAPDELFIAKADFIDLGTDSELVRIGKADAPIAVIGYLSLTCPNCRSFFTSVLPKLKADYIDRGLVHSRALIWAALLSLPAPALACGGGGGTVGAGEGGGDGAGVADGGAPMTVATALAAADASAEMSTQAAAAIAELAAASGIPGLFIEVFSVSGRTSTTSMSVEVRITDSAGERIFRRYVVLRIPLQSASVKPNALAVALSGVVSRMLIEDVARRVASRPQLAEGVMRAADRLASVGKGDFNLSAG